jgi:hypothetical protein
MITKERLGQGTATTPASGLMKQRNQAARASSSRTSPLDLLPSFEEIRCEKRDARKADLLVEAKSILTYFANCCRAGGKQVPWPADNVYVRLNNAVRDLSRIARNGRDTRTLWNSYKAVNHQWPTLQLCKRISDFVERANRNTPERPLEWFARLAQSAGEDAQRAFEFVKLAPDIRSKKQEPGLVDWRHYERVFLRFRNSDLRPQQRAGRQLCPKVNRPGDERLVAYTVFLEIECVDADWCRKHFDGFRGLANWVWRDLQNIELLGAFDRMFESLDVLAQAVDGLKGLSAAMSRKRDALAHRRWRAKKSPQEN